MISNNSIKVYIIKNGFLLAIGYMYYLVLNMNYAYTLLFTILRNIGMSKAIEYSTKERRILNVNYKYPEGEYIFYVIQGAVIETTTTYLTLPSRNHSNLIFFIPMSFIFEIIFDFFFYWSHRCLHTFHLPWHKVHHEHIHLKPILTFYQDWVDILLTVSLPYVLTKTIVNYVYPLSYLDISLLLTYKIFTEIAGHSGHESSPSCGFPQCVWLPRIFNIELYTEDHNLHHVNPGCNFSKRFRLWDKVFGTFRTSSVLNDTPSSS